MGMITPDVARRARQVRFNPIRSLTPQSLASALDAFDTGWLHKAGLLWEMIEERDDVLSAVAPKRRKSVARRPWDVLKIDDSPTAERHAEALTHFYNNVTARNALDLNESGGFSTLVRQMMGAVLHKYAVHEIVWQPGRDRRLTAEFHFVPIYFFENRDGKLRYTGPEMFATGRDLDEDGWMITVGDGLMKALSICRMFKQFSLQDWLNYSEKFGLPAIHGSTSAAKGSPEWEAFVSGLEQFANDYIIATSEGAEIKLIETTRTGEAPFAPMVERMDRRMAMLCRGADLGTLSSEDATGASLQDEEGDLLLEDDCQLITETLNTQVDRRVIRFLFGPVEPLAYVHIKPPVRSDTKEDIQVDEFLLRSGGQLEAAETYERYGRHLPEAMSDAMLEKRQTAPVPVGESAAANDATEAANRARATLAADIAPVRAEIERALAAGDESGAALMREVVEKQLSSFAALGHAHDEALFEELTKEYAP